VHLENSDKVVLIDEKDFNICARIKWRINRHGYAKAGSGVGLMHRFILNGKLEKDKSLTVHHRNHNKLDNRRSNLQVVDCAEHLRLERLAILNQLL
jgi:hypothetical protein